MDLVIAHIPRRAQIDSQLEMTKREAPLTLLFPTKVLTHDGRLSHVVGPADQDPEGHRVQLLMENVTITAWFLNVVIQTMVGTGELTLDRLDELVQQSPLVPSGRAKQWTAGFAAYLNGNPVAAIHILVPQAEGILREYADQIGVPVWRANEQGGQNCVPLGTLLRHPAMSEQLSQDVVAYLQIVLTDGRGVNMRNTVCHGLWSDQYFTAYWATVLLHVCLLMLQLEVRPVTGPTDPMAS